MSEESGEINSIHGVKQDEASAKHRASLASHSFFIVTKQAVASIHVKGQSYKLVH